MAAKANVGKKNVGEYIQLLKDFLAAIKAGEYLKAWKISVKIQQVIVNIISGGETVNIMTAKQTEEIKSLRADIGTSLQVAESSPSAKKLGDGKIVAWLIKIGLIVVGIPLPFEAPVSEVPSGENSGQE